MEYKGINLPKEITIMALTYPVEGHEDIHQGYVVNPEDKKQLENAAKWAKVGTENKYKNGEFKLNLYASAGQSSQGGKLSFWNCILIAPDDKKYLIGIDQNTLSKLLKNTTIIKGEVQEKVWLGREKGKVCAYTESMEEFVQAQKDEDKRTNSKATTKYEVGDVVGTLTREEIYLGEMYQLFEVDYGVKDICTYYSGRILYLKIYKKPKKMYSYGYEGAFKYNNATPMLRDKKIARFIYDKKSDITLDKYVEHNKSTENKYKDSPDRYLQSLYYSGQIERRQYSLSENRVLTESEIEELKGYILAFATRAYARYSLRGYSPVEVKVEYI